MRPLIINKIYGDYSTPNIILDKDNNKFEISGNSLPEDVFDFYKPIYKWIEDYIKQPNPKTKLVLKPVYFNSSSCKALLDILMIFKNLALEGCELEVEWKYLEVDDDLLATGKEFQGLTKIPFKFVPYRE
jgi:hypothetical protein